MDADLSFANRSNISEVSTSQISSKGNSLWAIDTFLRIKPLTEVQPRLEYNIKDVPVSDYELRSLFELEIPLDSDPGILHNNSLAGNLKFEFNKVMDERASQDAVFETVAKNKIDGVLEGINSTIFAYGQTGSGKTYSIFGGDSFKDRGIIPRGISYLFDKILKRKSQDATFDFKFKVSFTQVYQETIYDLLHQDFALDAPPPVVQVFENEDGIVLRNLNVFEVDSHDSALKLFFYGNSNRITASTAMNIASSRSHAVFTIVIETEGLVDEKTVYTSGKLNFVDLAGSERMYKMPNSQALVKEAKSINLSLHFLEQVIVSLRDNMKSLNNGNSIGSGHDRGSGDNRPSTATSSKNNSNGNSGGNSGHPFVPYRNSVLTNMLRDSLGGNCKSSFLLTISQERIHFEETVATCRFGQRCGEVKVKIRPNTEIGLTDQLKDLQQRVKMLEKKLAVNEDERRSLTEKLSLEEMWRHQQTQLRTLSVQEKALCKSCVQELLTAAKESVSSSSSGVSVGSSDNSGNVTMSEQIILRSQDALYSAVESMDKAVLVELSTALGGLVQSMYIERELSKQEEIVKESKRQQKEVEEEQRAQGDKALLEMFYAGHVIVDQNNPVTIPPSILDILQRGRYFFKHGRYGQPKLRHFSLARDMKTLGWYSVECAPAVGCKSGAIDLNTIARVDKVQDKFMAFRFVAKNGDKDLVLEWLCGRHSEYSFDSECNIWLQTLNILIQKHGR